MIKQIIVDMLVRKIKNQEINPNTGEAFKVEDIKVAEYQNAVQEII
ncbi:hypothetical protein [Maledivibacter halophilus]|uniref:Uncharacterized protein n=1 Tax=Maledivibacter halophilus TaxID=36842 RepID=A0A1T5M3Q1_9FIRM|nr:hypothetical protein [Maledivibacter halophilus]SKC82881.1 hypothetical protein SAMN02194393_03768 [Maledivibacter halophilus]